MTDMRAKKRPVDPHEFRRRHRAYHRALLLALGSWLLPVIAAAASSRLGFIVSIFFALLMLLVFAYFSRRYRCPSCGARPIDADGDEPRQLPANCQECGLSFRV